MDTAGKAVLFSGLTVVIALSTVMLGPAPAFRSMAAGIMLSVFFVLLATLTLLPVVLGKLGDKVNALPLKWVRSDEHRSARFARWGELLWRRPRLIGGVAVAILVLLAAPVIGLRTAMPSIKVVPATDSARVGYDLVQSAFGPGARGQFQIITTPADAAAAEAVLAHDPGITAALPAQRSTTADLVMIGAVPNVDPSSPAIGSTIDRLRGSLPAGSLVGGAAAENHDLQVVLAAKTPEVIAWSCSSASWCCWWPCRPP
jgi:RND superfamily putative drug exporter